MEIDQANWKSLADYTYLESVTSRELDGKGRTKKTEATVWDVLLLGGTEFRRKIARDGQPLPAREAAEEERKLERERARRLHESESQQARRIAKETEQRQQQRAFARQIPEAFLFSLSGEDTIDGEPVWVISATPRAGFKPTAPHADILKKVGGRLWIAKQSYQWLRFEAEVLSPVNFGWVLARLKPGSHFSVQQIKVGEIWAPWKADFDLDARLALLKGLRAVVHLERTQYRRFSTDSRIISIEDGSKQ